MSQGLGETHDEDQARAKARTPRRYPIAIVALMALCAVIAWGAAAWWWLSPVAAALVYLMMVVPTAGFTTLLALFVDPTKTHTALAREAQGAPALQERLRLAWWPLAAAGVLGLAGVCSWAAPPVRQSAARLIGAQQQLDPLRRCLSDASPDVAIACCEATRGWASAALQDDYAVWMLNHPQHHNACMVEATSPRPSSLIVERLADVWTRELMRPHPRLGQREADALCQRASFLRHADRVEQLGASLRLTRCALSAPEHAARQCCEAELRQLIGASPSLASALPPPDRALRETRDGLLIQLLHAASPGAPDEVQARAMTLKLDTPELRAWALQTSCAALASPSGHDLAQVRARMLLLLHASGCEGLPGDVQITDMTCSARVQEEGVSWAPQAMCQELHAAHRIAAVESARLAMRRGVLHAQSRSHTHDKFERDTEVVNHIISTRGQNSAQALDMVKRSFKLPGDLGTHDELIRKKIYGRSMREQSEAVRDLVINQGVSDPVELGKILRAREAKASP